ncbi:cap methyltransferase 1 [Augochlora pura]
MKSHSDDSDFDVLDIEDNNSDIYEKETMEEKEVYQNYVNKRSKKRSNDTSVDESSDLNDSDYNENYYENSDEKNDPHSSSLNRHQNSSYENDSAGECSSQNVEKRHVDDTTSNSNDEQDDLVTPGMGYTVPTKRQKIEVKNENNESTVDAVNIYDKEEQPWHRQNVGEKLMKKMGYTGLGLGKHEQGRTEPVEAAKQHGRRGFGHHIPGLEAFGYKWDPSEEEIKVKEPMKWLKNHHEQIPTSGQMKSWLKKAPKKLIIDDETQFCDNNIVTNIIKAKTIFDKLDGIEMRRARTRSNPFETIHGAFFLNRAAMKMANMDKACDFMFTQPNGLQDDELLYFADVCAGPGGFSEYVLWRKEWHAKGFGFTLKNENDFKLADFYAGPCETFYPYYGPADDGNVYDPANQEAFRELIMKYTNNKGVHFMMSDGGFSVAGQENIQEILSKQLYLCQCLVALMIVREGGHFVTKLFDVFTPFSAGIVYLMYRCFDEVCIFKPNTSRPANSERYLICKSKRPNTELVVQYFKHINEILLKKDENNDVREIVAFEEFVREKELLEYLHNSNNELGRKQITGLRKVAAFCEDIALVEPKQATLRKECLEYWNIPDKSRTMPVRMKPQDKVRSLLTHFNFLSKTPMILTKETLGSIVSKRPLDYFCVPCGSGKSETIATFYLSLGRSKVYRYVKGNWEDVNNNIQLPADTLIYAEQLYEMTKQRKNQRKLLALHIIDAYFLGAQDVSNKSLQERHKLAKKFCEALRNPDGIRIRTKDLFTLRLNIGEKLCVQKRIMKNSQTILAYELSDIYSDDDSSFEKPYFAINSVMFLKAIAEPWSLNVSSKVHLLYVYNSKTQQSEYLKQKPDKANANFIETFSTRLVWHWPTDETISMKDLVNSMTEKCPNICKIIDTDC